MTVTAERMILTESVRTPRVRDNCGVLTSLGRSILSEGMRHPITLWKDGTLISGARRHRAVLMAGHTHIQAEFVDTIEDAAKALLRDNTDEYQALPMKWTEVCRLWELLRRLDAPAAVLRAEAARRRGVELRRQTQAGRRKPGRATHSEDYVLSTLAPPFGMSGTTAKRLWTIYGYGYGIVDDIPDVKREEARQALFDVDAGLASISASYDRLLGGTRLTRVSRPRPVVPAESADARAQQAAWERSLPRLEGLVSGLSELGPPNTDLTWEQVGPVHTRLMAVRRELEKIIKQMRESNKS